MLQCIERNYASLSDKQERLEESCGCLPMNNYGVAFVEHE